MRVSVIVPVRNEADNIRCTLNGLAAQHFPADEFEILVVDGQSEDDTSAIVRELQATIRHLHLFDNPKRLASAARNIGIHEASGNYLVIVDGHCQVRDPHFLTKLVEAFETSGADTLGRPQPLRSERPTTFQAAVAAARASWLGHNPDSAIFSNEARFVQADNVAVAYRREVFERIGRFDESFDACEDVEFNTRARHAGLTCYFTPEIAIEYQPRASLRALAYQMARYGRGRAKLGRKHPSTMTLPSLVPPIWLMWLAFGFIAAMIWWPMGIVLAASIALYGMMIVFESFRLGLLNRNISFCRLPLVFAAIHIGFGWGYLKESLGGVGSLPLRRLLRVRLFSIRR